MTDVPVKKPTFQRTTQNLFFGAGQGEHYMLYLSPLSQIKCETTPVKQDTFKKVRWVS